MTTPARQIPLSELENLTRGSVFERTFYVLRRWPLIPILILSVLSFCAIFAPLIAPHSPSLQNREALLWPPGWMEGGTWAYPLGTDALGRDIFSRLIFGARFSLFIGVVVVTLSVSVGVIVGLIAGN